MVKNIIIKKIIVERLINSFSFSILNVEIRKEKKMKSYLDLLKTSINNKADPIDINSKVH